MLFRLLSVKLFAGAAAVISSLLVCMGDTLSLDGIEPGSNSVDLGIRFKNENAIVGMQFDLRYPEGQLDTRSAAVRSKTDHVSRSTKIAGNTRRVVVYSPSNALFPSDLILSIPLDLSASSPAGGPSLVLENILLTNAEGVAFAATVAYHPVEVWRRKYFDEFELFNPGVVSDDSDPDFDGIPNLYEYLFGTDPKGWDSSETIRVTRTSGDAPYLVSLDFVFPRARDIEGAFIVGQVSPDLDLWTEVSGPPLLVDDSDPNAQTFKLSIMLDLRNEKAFGRLAAERNLNAVPEPDVP